MGLSERSSSLSDILVFSESSSVASSIDSTRDDDASIRENISTNNTPIDDTIIGIPHSSKHYQLASSTSSSHDDESVEYKPKGRRRHLSSDKGKSKASFNDSSDSFIGTFNPVRRKKRPISSSSSQISDTGTCDMQLFNNKTSAPNLLPVSKSQDSVKSTKGKKKKRKSRVCMKPLKKLPSKDILSPYLLTPFFDNRERARTAATPGVDKTMRAAVLASHKCEHSGDGLRAAQKVIRKNLHGSPHKFGVGTGQNITIPQRPKGTAIANGGSQANYRSKQHLSLELTPVVPKTYKSSTAGMSYSHSQLSRPTPHLSRFPKPKKLNLSRIAETSQQQTKPISCTSGNTRSSPPLLSLPKQKKPKLLQINV